MTAFGGAREVVEGMATALDRRAMTQIDKHRRDIDWQAIKADYCANAMSLRELAQKHGCAHSTIANGASRNGWVRGPNDRVNGDLLLRSKRPSGRERKAS